MRIPKKVVLCVHLFTDWSCPSQCWPRAIQPHSAKSSDHHLTKKVLVAILTQKKKKKVSSLEKPKILQACDMKS
jgi:hypothetical protein